MLDWLTLKLPFETFHPFGIEKYKERSGRIVCIDPDGTIKWEKVNRESIRSDSHQLIFDVCGDCLMLHGSPARVMHDHNVFGSGDPVECANAMILFAAMHTEITLPFENHLWKATRMDVTHNYDLGSAAEVRQALSYLRQSEGGRFQVRTQSETVYWSSKSALRSMKAYHKGPQIRYQAKKHQCWIDEEEINLCDRLLRLELSLKGQFWRERAGKPWYLWTEQDLNQKHEQYFNQVIGKIEVVEMDNLLGSFEKVLGKDGKPISKGQAMAVYSTYTRIKVMGFRETEATMPRATFMRHRKIMFDAGLTYADFHAGSVVPFRRRTIELGRPVQSFAQILRAA